MKEFFRHHAQTILIMVFWTLCGLISSTLAYAVVPITVVFLKLRHRYKEIFFGFIFIIILSDQRYSFFSFAKSVKEVYFFLMGVFLLFDRKLFTPLSHFIGPFIGFFGIALFCTLYYPEDYFNSLLKLLAYTLAFLNYPNYTSKLYRDDPKNFLHFFIYFMMFLLTLNVILYLPFGAQLSISGRYMGIMGNPNSLGLFCIILSIFITIINDIEEDLFTRKQKAFFWIVIITNILLARSRTTFITLAMFGIFGFAFKRSTLFGLLTVAFLFLTNIYIVEIVQTIAQTLGLEEFLRLNDVEKGSGRLVAWLFAWKEINENTFFLGNGFDYTNYYFGINYDKLSLLGHQGNAHNSYLTFWLETGLVGLLFFMYGFVKSFLNMSYKSRYAIPAMFAISFSMFFESWFTAGMNPYLIQVLMLLVLVDLPRVEEAEKEKEIRKYAEQEEQFNRLSHFSFLRK